MSLSPEQIAMRRTGLTASDIVVLSGTVPFKKARTLYDVFLDKCYPDSVKPTEVTEAMALGHAMERPIIEYVARREGIAVLYPQTTIRHPKIEWAMCTPDAVVIEGPAARPGVYSEATGFGHRDAGLVECKLVGLHMVPHWDRGDNGEEGPPDYVYTQSVWQGFVRGLPWIIVAAMAGTEIRTHRIDMDDAAQEYARVLVEIGQKFLTDHVWPKRPPPVDGSEASRRMLVGLFPRNNGVMLKARTDDEESARAYFEGQRMVKAGEELKDQAKTALMAYCRDADGVTGDGWRLYWKMRKGYTQPAREVEAGRAFDLRKKA